ncbi:MAG: transcription-repair coupling factor (superfamily II helicase) [Verrucomicrobiales bacterium]|jgi:transcription-repair coupling factor (superfamily II helicase)
MSDPTAPPLGALLKTLLDEPGLVSVMGRRSALVAVPQAARPLSLAAIADQTERAPVVVAVPTSTEAERLRADLALYLGEEAVALFPAWETLPFERISPNVETMGRRLEVLWRLQDPARAPKVVVSSARALVQRLGPGIDDLEPIIVGVGDQVDISDLARQLVDAGYRREPQVESRGHFAVRGSIIDVFPSTARSPVRIDLWGDEVERLSEFGVNDQRSTVTRSEVVIHAAREVVASEAIADRARTLVSSAPWGREHWERLADGEFFDGMESWLPWLTDRDSVLIDHVGSDALVVLVEPRRLRDRAGDIRDEEADLATTLARTWGAIDDDGDAEDEFPRLHVPFDRILSHTDAPVWTMTTAPEGPEVAVIAATGWESPIGDPPPLVTQLRRLIGDGFRIIVGADGSGTAPRLAVLLADNGIHLPVVDALDDDASGIVVAPLERGAVFTSTKLAVMSESDITGRRRTHRRARARANTAQDTFDDLGPGDYVVHQQHGVARFAGMVTRAIGGVERDYLLLEYRGDDKLYIPSDQIGVVRHYTGGDSPTLSKMGGSDWAKAKAKVRSEVAEIAQELVVLYQRRITAEGFAFALDTPFQRELEDSFAFEETPDQLTAIIDVKQDMERPYPMDRLVVGDVGFGKTEIAIRAAFKAVQDNKQVAVLVPTTLLAQQHHQTFSERFASFPVRVEVLSRFLTNAQAKKVITDANAGKVDVLIGTHRMLNPDLTFKDLGLLVVDEEQRFGVKHKEKIKTIRTDVDVLTLTATPVPRTLEMSLTGIRDMTLLSTAPSERQPILTYVGEQNDRAITEAIRRELLREGQVFFVHNRVQDIEHTAARIREMVPEARIAIAHGQMDEGSLEQIMLDFWDGQYDVLVCTTIIESGIDMPSVNTLVVDRADLLGLGQMHQLRGRVGRSGQRAYAYLMVPRDKSLTEQAYERLKTIGEATELGSGFKIAMRDLEIRGAGNLLGTGQSGHIAAVGYDLYCQMVTEAVSELKGETIEDAEELKIELPIKAFLPTAYMETEDQRLEAYRRLAAITTSTEVEDVRTEWLDRYGPLPEPVANLLDVGAVRAACIRVGITELTVGKGPGFGGPEFVVRMSPLALPTSKQIRLDRVYKHSVYKEADGGFLQLGMKKGNVAQNIVTALNDLVPLEDE